MAHNPPDSELIKRAKGGDESAIVAIYERYASSIYRYIFFRVGEQQVAEDIQGEVFLRMIEGIHRYEERGWPISAWLYRIAHDRTIDTLRRYRTRQQVPLEQCSGVCDGPETSVDRRLQHEEIVRIMANLTDQQRQVIHLRFIADLSIQEVASRLGRTEGSVKALQHRGLQAIARHLATSPAAA
jgi:RNA polymerase sigma-70 factor (ECF subfamily)